MLPFESMPELSMSLGCFLVQCGLPERVQLLQMCLPKHGNHWSRSSCASISESC